MSSITLLLLLCVIVHACNARSLGIFLEHKQAHLEESNKAFLLNEEAASKSETSGDHIVVPYQTDLQRLAKTEVLLSSQTQAQAQAQARSLIGSSPDDTDEAIESKENDFVEDTVVMDYAQPHRKPPIHNEKP